MKTSLSLAAVTTSSRRTPMFSVRSGSTPRSGMGWLAPIWASVSTWVRPGAGAAAAGIEAAVAAGAGAGVCAIADAAPAAMHSMASRLPPQRRSDTRRVISSALKVQRSRTIKEDRSAALTGLRDEYSTQFSANYEVVRGVDRELKRIQFTSPYSGKRLNSVAPVCANGSSVWRHTGADWREMVQRRCTILHKGRKRHVEE